MKNITKIIYAIVVALLHIQSISAQAPVFDDNVQDVQAAPIDDWIFLMALLGIAIIGYHIKKKEYTES